MLLFLVQVSAGTPAKPVKRVLILNEVGASSPGLKIIDNGIMTALQDSPYHIQFYIEYMDSVLFPEPADQQRFRDFYIAKYTKRKPDVIVTVGSTPLQFMVEAHRQFFPGIPIVFCLRNGAHLPLDPEFTGVEDTIAVAETLEAALRLVPGTKHVVVIGGVSAWDRQEEAVVKEAIKPYEERFDISYHTDLSLPDLLDRVSHLTDHTIVLMATLTQDGNGTLYVSAAESGPMLAGASNAPVFSFFDPFLNHGIVGGDLSDFDKQGRAAGNVVLKLLNGERPQDIPIVKDVTTYMFDWKALKRWGMKESNLPPGSIVINRQPTFWELYKWYVISGIALVLAETALILGLLWQRRRRAAAERELRESDQHLRSVLDEVRENEERLRLAVQAGRMFAYSWDAATDVIERSGEAAEILGMDETQGATGASVAAMVHPEDKEKVETALANLNVDEPYLQVTYRITRPDGVVVWLQRNSRAYFNEHSELERIVGMIVDVTERKLAEEALSTVSRRLIQAQEQERTRIARELHDDINQRLAMLQVELNQAQQSLPDSQSSTRELLMEIQNRLSETSNEVQAISHRLHSSKLEYLGLVTACRAFCKEIADRQEVRIEFNADGISSTPSPDVALTLFRVLQESLHNAIKHSHVERFQVSLRGTSREIKLTVHDDGVGFDVDAAINDRGLGLISMRERVSLVNGTILISSKPMGGGTEINVRIPLAVEEEVKREDASKVTSGAA